MTKPLFVAALIFITSLVFSSAKYRCLCVFDNLAHPIYREPNVSSHVIGFLPPNQCKLYLFPVDAEFGAVMVFHQKGFIHLNTPGMNQICEGNPTTEDVFTTLKPTTNIAHTKVRSTLDSALSPTLASTTLHTTHSSMLTVFMHGSSKIDHGLGTGSGGPFSSEITTRQSASIGFTKLRSTTESSHFTLTLVSTTPSTTILSKTLTISSKTSSASASTTPSTTPTTHSTTRSTTRSLTPSTTRSTTLTTTTSSTPSTTSTIPLKLTKQTSTSSQTILEGHIEICPKYVKDTDVQRFNGFLGQYGEFCYELVNLATQYINAERHCQIVSTGQLVHVMNQDQQDFLVRFLNRHHYVQSVWLGLTDSGDANEGTWRWSSGALFSYNNFKGEYSHHSSHDHKINDCVIMKQGGEWTDVSCGVALVLGTGFGEKHPYICQYNVSSSLPNIVPNVVVG